MLEGVYNRDSGLCVHKDAALVFEMISRLSVREGSWIDCVTGWLDVVFDSDASLSVPQGCSIECLLGMLR